MRCWHNLCVFEPVVFSVPPRIEHNYNSHHNNNIDNKSSGDNYLKYDLSWYNFAWNNYDEPDHDVGSRHNDLCKPGDLPNRAPNQPSNKFETPRPIPADKWFSDHEQERVGVPSQ